MILNEVLNGSFQCLYYNLYLLFMSVYLYYSHFVPSSFINQIFMRLYT